MNYVPKEGVDYLVNLYSVVGVAPDVSRDELRPALNELSRQYHPDRLEGLAPELRSRGEEMTVLLNRARGILLDPERRHEYDEILAQWPGPVSEDGVPVITLERRLQAHMEQMSAEELDTLLVEHKAQIEAMTGHSPNQIAFFESLMNQMGNKAPEDLKRQYEESLLTWDRSLAVQENAHGRLIGLGIEDRQYRVGFNYGDQVVGEIEAAGDSRRQWQMALSTGRFAARLAILSGEADVVTADMMTSQFTSEGSHLPSYFVAQAARVEEVAREREAVLQKRLGLFEPDYPESELQTSRQPRFMVGIRTAERTLWMEMYYDPESESVQQFEEANTEIITLLDQGNFTDVISQGYNVYSFDLKDHIDVMTLLETSVAKYLHRFPEKTSE